MFVEAKYLLCSFAFLWSSAIVPSSVKRGLGFLVLFSPLRLFKRDQALVPSLFRSKFAHVCTNVSLFEEFRTLVAIAAVLLNSILLPIWEGLFSRRFLAISLAWTARSRF